MKKLLIALALLAFAQPAAALLYCMDGVSIAYWTVGQPLPPAWDNLNLDYSLECGASGAELSYVLSHFQGMRSRSVPTLSGSRFIYWNGDDALFIVGNL